MTATPTPRPEAPVVTHAAGALTAWIPALVAAAAASGALQVVAMRSFQMIRSIWFDRASLTICEPPMPRAQDVLA